MRLAEARFENTEQVASFETGVSKIDAIDEASNHAVLKDRL